MPFDGLIAQYEAELDAYERSLQIAAARHCPNAFIEYAFRGDGGRPVRQEKAHREWQQIWTDYEKSVILGPVGTGKALPVETLIAVPGGWKPIGELKVGDLVIGGDGQPTRVTYVSPVWTDRDVFELALSDDTTIRCDAEHLWAVRAADGAVLTLSTWGLLRSFARRWQIPALGGSWGRRIVAWRRVPSVPVRCIAVEAAHRTYVATKAEIVTHNTTQLRGRLLWEIGQDPDDTRVAYVSATQGHPKKQLGALKEEIVLNPRVRHVFPRLRPGEGEREVWSSTQILVARDSNHPDVTLEVFGLYGGILGSRKTIIVFDDLCNFSNTLTQVSREKMADWLSEVLSRLKGKTRIWAIGHIWHEDDALQVLVKKEGWRYARYEATTRDPATGAEKPTFPTILPAVKIASLCADLGPIYSEMMLWNRMPPATASRFKERWFAGALQAGRGLSQRDPRTREWSQPYAASYSGPGLVYSAADFGHTKKIGSDLTVFVTAVLFEDGTRRVLDVRSGRWKADEIVREIMDLRERFDPTFFLEDNGGQQMFCDLVEGGFAIPVNKSHTGRDKYHYQNGIEGLGQELRAGLWILPCDTDLVPHDDVAAMIKGAKGYNPAKHPADHLMAWWILRKAMVQYPRGVLTGPPPIDPQGHV